MTKYNVSIPARNRETIKTFGSLRAAKTYARSLSIQQRGVDELPLVQAADYPHRYMRFLGMGRGWDCRKCPDAWANA